MGMKKKEINYQLLIRRICLIVLDIICIIAASILALLTRFEFDFSQIPKEFLKVIYKYGPFTIVITLIIFSLFRIYSSLWEYAGIEEVFSLIAACLAAADSLLRHNLISVIASDAHSPLQRTPYMLDAYEELSSEYSENHLDVLFQYNPARLCDNREILRLEPVPYSGR